MRYPQPKKVCVTHLKVATSNLEMLAPESLLGLKTVHLKIKYLIDWAKTLQF